MSEEGDLRSSVRGDGAFVGRSLVGWVWFGGCRQWTVIERVGMFSAYQVSHDIAISDDHQPEIGPFTDPLPHRTWLVPMLHPLPFNSGMFLTRCLRCMCVFVGG